MEDDHIKGNNTTVDSAKADRSIWLMKCPPVVSKAWQSSAASGDSPPLAKVVVSLDPLQSEDPSALQFTMEMAGNEVVNMPKSYSLNMFKDFVPMCVFSQTNQVIGPYANSWLAVQRAELPFFPLNCLGIRKKAAPVKSSEVKRTRRDRGELEDIMFKLFERQPNWALKQLVQETDQPAQFLKEILNELCVYNKRGTNQGTYELKPEYKKSVADTSAV
ncbi:UNVERIFIED_CONTAM: hypothetical protein Scaly_1129500 [Sesamum calycinum]|uniref:Transcription initiation factor IIF subunit beta n=1 Tax=Sesamum calycinum TaxID=2727403 RepID=A0AAW2QN01_9LAMI